MVSDIDLSPSFETMIFLHSLTKAVGHFAIKYDTPLIMGYFNMESNNSMFKSFSDSNKLSHLINNNTCFKG